MKQFESCEIVYKLIVQLEKKGISLTKENVFKEYEFVLWYYYRMKCKNLKRSILEKHLNRKGIPVTKENLQKELKLRLREYEIFVLKTVLKAGAEAVQVLKDLKEKEKGENWLKLLVCMVKGVSL
ncbi:MAG: hypothetical protein H7329_18370 [Opitutaceae bacterium]|nr:hypothetical protein [Cytophagales bacterium]